MLSRRQVLFAGAAVAAGGLAPNPVAAALLHHHERSVFLYNVHTGESLRTVYWSDGRYQNSAMRQVNHILRDHYSGDVHQMAPRVVDLLYLLHHRLGARKPFNVISGYRSPATNAWLASMTDGVAQHSMHMEGKAVDIRLEGANVFHIGRAAKSLRLGGVGEYPNSDFVHVDVGPVRYW